MDPQQFNRAVQRYGDMVFKIVMVIVRDPDEAQDAVQDTFFRYYRKAPAFESEQHEKAWLIRCATNTAKSQRTSAQHHRHEELHASIAVDAPESRVLPELLFFFRFPTGSFCSCAMWKDTPQKRFPGSWGRIRPRYASGWSGPVPERGQFTSRNSSESA